jgi:hypothetical protein
LNDWSAICEYAYLEPVWGSKGPLGRSYFAATQLSNCGYVAFGRIPLVAMNELALPWFCALSAPLNDQLRPFSGVSVPNASKMSPVVSSTPAPRFTRNPPNQYSSVSLTPSPEPPRSRQR